MMVDQLFSLWQEYGMRYINGDFVTFSSENWLAKLRHVTQ